MSATNATTNYSFPLFIGTDKPAWLVDWNSTMSAIDAAIKGVDTDVQGAIVDISGLSSTVAAHTASISTISGQITVITTNLNTATGNINTINSLIGNGTPTTTDQTIIGAINELHANQGDLADLTTPAASLVAAINAITGGGGAVAASAVSYSNTVSGLSATNVQAAIDELAAGGAIDAEDIAYDNTQSGLTATDVQAAIDELAVSASYSTTERAVGVDTDGSVIYEKTYVNDNANITSDTVIDATLTPSTVKNMVMLNANYYTDSWDTGTQDVTSGETRYVVRPRINAAGLGLLVMNNTVTKYHITVRYTKN